MFRPSREKIERALAYLDEVQRRPKSFADLRTRFADKHRHGQPRWRSLPKHLHAQAESRYNILLCKYREEHGHAASQQKRASLIGNIAQNLLNPKATLRGHHRVWNAKKCAYGPWIDAPNWRRVTRRDPTKRTSQGNLAGI